MSLRGTIILLPIVVAIVIVLFGIIKTNRKEGEKLEDVIKETKWLREEIIKLINCPHDEEDIEFVEDSDSIFSIYTNKYLKRCKKCGKVLKGYKTIEEYLKAKKEHLKAIQEKEIKKIDKRLDERKVDKK